MQSMRSVNTDLLPSSVEVYGIADGEWGVYVRYSDGELSVRRMATWEDAADYAAVTRDHTDVAYVETVYCL